MAIIIVIEFGSLSPRRSMEFDAEQHTVSGSIPDFGAIFMSNCSTKKECFRKKVFGLPSNQSNFVKKVRDGMFLFLFEFEKRELYGVFQASCNGSMNIIPDAFKSSGKQFPAQICFRTIWVCSPLSEYDFRDAIKDNYYSPYKFNFGLSEDQVDRLLQLFESRIVKDLRTPILVARTKISRHFKISNWDSRFLKTYREKNNLNMGCGIEPCEVTRSHDLSMPREENSHVIDRSMEPFDATRNQGLPRSILDSSGCSEDHKLDKNDPLLEGYHRLSTGNHLEESLVSNLLASKFHGDAIMPSSLPVSTPSVDYRHPESPSIQYRQSLSFGQVSCAMKIADRIHPSSEGQFIYSPAEPRNFSRLYNPDGSTNLGDFIPLTLSPDNYETSSTGTPSGAGYLLNETIGVTNFEHCEGLSYADNPMPFTRSGDDGRATTKSSHFAFLTDKSSSYALDIGLPVALKPAYVHEGSCYKHYEASTSSAPFPSQLHLPKDGFHLESKKHGYYERSDPSYGNKDRVSMGLHSDNREKRCSVFSRLCAAQPGTGQLSGNYGYIVDMTSQDLKVLRHGYNSPRKTMLKTKQFIARQDDDDENFENISKNEMIIDVALPSEEAGWSSEEVAEEIPVINFKRRSKVRRVLNETKTSGCIEGTKHKRRKLVRPAFSPMLQLSPQETCNGTGNKGSDVELESKSSDISGRGYGGKKNGKDSAENDGLQNPVCTVSFKGNNSCRHCLSSEDSKVEMLCIELFGNSCSCSKCEGSSQEISEDNGNAGRGEPLLKSDSDKKVDN